MYSGRVFPRAALSDSLALSYCQVIPSGISDDRTCVLPPSTDSAASKIFM